MSVNIYSTAHLVAKQAVDEVDLISRLAWFGGDPEIKVANSCIQLLFKCQILGKRHYTLQVETFKICPKYVIFFNVSCILPGSPSGWVCTWHWSELSTWVMDHFTMTFLAKTLNMVARYFTYAFWSGPTGACTSTQKVKESWDPRREKIGDDGASGKRHGAKQVKMQQE